jgi:hypothetical protein
MKSLESEIERLSDVIKKTSLTPMRKMPIDALHEINKIDAKVSALLLEIITSCKVVDELNDRKQRIINNVIIKDKYRD